MLALPDHDLQSVSALFREWGCKPAHAGKVLRAFYANSGRLDLNSLDIGIQLRKRLADIPQRRSTVLTRHHSADGTLKLLVGFNSPTTGSAETVLMPGHRDDRAAGCVSSQIGC